MKAIIRILFVLALPTKMANSLCSFTSTKTQKYDFDCTRFWEITSTRILGIELLRELKCCPEESSFLEETGECDGPPAWCRPDCFGRYDNPLMEWSEWGHWSRVYSGFSKIVEERYRHLKGCQYHQNYHPFRQRQERRRRKKGKQRFEYIGEPYSIAESRSSRAIIQILAFLIICRSRFKKSQFT